MLTAIDEVLSLQEKPTMNTKEKIPKLLDYLHTSPNAKVRFYSSDMNMHIDSNTAYLVAPKAKSCIAGFFNYSNNPVLFLNGSAHVECRILPYVITLAAEAALFYNTQTILELIHMYMLLDIQRHPNPSKLTMW